MDNLMDMGPSRENTPDTNDNIKNRKNFEVEES